MALGPPFQTWQVGKQTQNMRSRWKSSRQPEVHFLNVKEVFLKSAILVNIGILHFSFIEIIVPLPENGVSYILRDPLLTV